MELSEDFVDELPSYIDADAVAAWMEIQGLDEGQFSLRDFEEAYVGFYRSDEEFAEETADQLGLLDNDSQWPYSCIDWGMAARELMYDHTEQDGYYFRIC